MTPLHYNNIKFENGKCVLVSTGIMGIDHNGKIWSYPVDIHLLEVSLMPDGTYEPGFTLLRIPEQKDFS